MSENAEIMVHNSSIEASGGAQEMRSACGQLLQLNRKMAKIIAQRSGQPVPIVKAWMDEERWFSAQDAKTLVFATHFSSAVQATASLDVSSFKNTPLRVKQRAEQLLIRAMKSGPKP